MGCKNHSVIDNNNQEEISMLTFEQESIQITDVDVIREDDGFYTVVTYSDGKFDEFGPFSSYSAARAAIYGGTD